MNETKSTPPTRPAAPDQDMRKWHALAEGKLSPSEAEALHAADPELYEAYRPYDAGEEQRLVDAVLRRLPPPPPPPPPVWAQAWQWLTAPGHPGRFTAVALAACLVIGAGPALRSMRPHGVHMREEATRGQDDGSAQILAARDARVGFSLIQETDAEPGPVVQRGALLRRDDDGTILPFRGHVNDQASDGSIQIAGTKQTFFPCVPEGNWTLLLAVGRPGKPLSEREILAHDDGVSTGDFQVIKKRFVLRGLPTDQEGKPCGGTTP